MQRYFFHTQTASRITDEEGTEFTSPREARAEAIRTSGELMRDGAASFWSTRPWLVTVTDGTGLILLEIEMHGHAAPAMDAT